MILKKPGVARVSVETSTKERGHRKNEPPKRQMREYAVEVPTDEPSEYIGHVSFRAGTTLARNYQSVTCHVEVTLPVALPSPVRGDFEEKSKKRVRRAIAQASELATEAYEQEAEELKQLLDEV